MEWVIPAIATFGGLGGAAFVAKYLNGRFEKRIEKMETALSTTILTKDKHDDLCKIASLNMMKHVSDVVKKSEDNVVERIGKILGKEQGDGKGA